MRIVLLGNCLLIGLLMVASPTLRADQVEMQNGDRYSGQVVSVTPDKLVLDSEILGRISVPRTKVAMVRLGANPNQASSATHASAPSAATYSTNRTVSTVASTNADFASAFRGSTNLIEQVRGQMLGTAGPEANQKFDALMGGLMSGTLTMDGLRQQAQSAVEQIHSLKQELGNDEAAAPLDGYLEILQNFLKETDSASTGPNQPAR